MKLLGATASLRGSALFAAFASPKFALRGLAQSLAREYGPQGTYCGKKMGGGGGIRTGRKGLTQTRYSHITRRYRWRSGHSVHRKRDSAFPRSKYVLNLLTAVFAF